MSLFSLRMWYFPVFICELICKGYVLKEFRRTPLLPRRFLRRQTQQNQRLTPLFLLPFLAVLKK